MSVRIHVLDNALFYWKKNWDNIPQQIIWFLQIFSVFPINMNMFLKIIWKKKIETLCL